MFFPRNIYSDIHICKEMFLTPFYWIKFAGGFPLYVNISHSTEQWKLTRTRLIFFILSIGGYIFCSLASNSRLLSSLSLSLSGVRSFFVRMLIVYACISLRIFARHLHTCMTFVDFEIYLSAIYDHQTMLFTFIFMWYTHYLYSKSVSNLYFYVSSFSYKHEMALVLCMYFKWKFAAFSYCCVERLTLVSMKSFWSIDIKGLSQSARVYVYGIAFIGCCRA